MKIISFDESDDTVTVSINDTVTVSHPTNYNTKLKSGCHVLISLNQINVFSSVLQAYLLLGSKDVNKFLDKNYFPWKCHKLSN